MQKVKLNISNNKQSSIGEKELIERARQSMEEKRIEKAVSIEAESKRDKGWIFYILFLLLIILTSAASFMFAKKRAVRIYKKFIPEAAIASTIFSAEKLSRIFKMPASLIFSSAVSAIKSEAAVLNLDIDKMLSEIKQDIAIVPVALSEGGLANVIIVELEDNFKKQDIEYKIRQIFNVSYQTYRGENIITVEPLELSRRDKSFSYSIVGNVLIASQNISALKMSIDAGK